MFVFPHLPTFQRIVSCVLSALRITNIRLLVYYSKLFIEFNIPLFPTLPHRCLLNIDLINGDMSWFSDTDGEYWNIQSSCDYKKRQQTTAIHPTLSGLFSLNFVNPERVLTLNWMWKKWKRCRNICRRDICDTSDTLGSVLNCVFILMWLWSENIVFDNV